MKNFKKVVGLLLTLMMIFTMGGCSTKAGTDKKGIKDGVYTGEGEGKGGKIVTEITIKDSIIKEIKVIESHDTEGLSEAAIKEMIDKVIANNSPDVDMVSGASITTKGLMEAINSALAKAGANANNLAKVKKVEEKEEAAEQNYDVVVIGGGGAGMIAAIEAKNAGANVVILEKMSFVGGNTMISGGEFAASENWLQAKENIKDSADTHYNDTLKGGDNKNDKTLVRKLADNALAAATWLKDYIKVEFEDELMFFGGHSVKRSLVPKGASGGEITKKLKAKVDELKIPVKLNTKASQLVTNDKGRVTGVKAEKNGKTIMFNAKNGVVMASGGFGRNIEMRKKYNPKIDEKILSTNSVGSTGDGIVMAEAIGADLVGMEYIQTYPICDPLSGMLLYMDDARLVGGTILVNKEGKRFVEELERRDVISNAITQQTGQCTYEFWDENTTKISKIAENHPEEMKYLITNKLLVKANTIKEVADFFGVDAKELENTVNRYNTFAKSGKDTDFNKRGKLTEFGAGPYYLMKAVPAVHHTMGGIKIDDETHVISKEGKVIEGLYSAGEVTGGVHGTNRLGSNAMADISVFGRIAGVNAAKGK
ncbi:urocanate reductase [Clostridium amylolyticum]|uniref:Urocanate reductase n=1 Tax=Clostridium amylolyticum TaxID=1121298 RepID=A0A1M6C5P6_9CLOT|nr:flavocytochrome c [Clostridium amylolyticum]SHI56336.1 urocanate reductase [Clostridium amylolyticum]